MLDSKWKPLRITSVHGAAVVSQSCDASLPHRERIQIAPVVELQAGYKHKRRRYIIERDDGRCQICRRRVVLDDPRHPRAAEVDHIIPISLWPEGEPGLNKPTNLRLLCRTCNSQKSNGTAPNGDQLMLIG